MKSESIIV